MSIRLCTALTIILAAAFAPLGAASAHDRASDAKDGVAAVAIWKTVSLGSHGGRYALFDALDAQDIRVGDAAQEVLHRPAFSVSPGRMDVQLVRVSVAQLGFGREGATLP